jgi:hypothetical protein
MAAVHCPENLTRAALAGLLCLGAGLGTTGCTRAQAAELAPPAQATAEAPSSCRFGELGDETGATSRTKSGICDLHGKVKIVSSFPKYKVKIVDSFPDIKVQKVTSFPDRAGRWQMVDSFPDFTIQIVDSFPDFTVKYVDSFPGCD